MTSTEIERLNCVIPQSLFQDAFKLEEPMNCNCRYRYFYDQNKWCPTCLVEFYSSHLSQDEVDDEVDERINYQLHQTEDYINQLEEEVDELRYKIIEIEEHD